MRIWLLTLLLLAGIAHAGDDPPVPARHGLDLAIDAAQSWAEDSYLIYVENDEPVDPNGKAARWGYLFYSPQQDHWRAYSLDDHEIVTAGDIEFAFDAPPVNPDWIDSAQAFAKAEKSKGSDYRKDHAGYLRSMLLIRGAFHEENPDKTTWTLVYDSPTAPSLFVVIDAESGDVVKTWKG